jgi:hypothetical protein
VAGAWLEARDRLRDHGVRAGEAMTVRDLAAVAGDDVGPGLRRLAECVDVARWSGAQVPPSAADEAWTATAEVGAGLGRRGRWRHIRAALSPRTLLTRSD